MFEKALPNFPEEPHEGETDRRTNKWSLIAKNYVGCQQASTLALCFLVSLLFSSFIMGATGSFGVQKKARWVIQTSKTWKKVKERRSDGSTWSVRKIALSVFSGNTLTFQSAVCLTHTSWSVRFVYELLLTLNHCAEPAMCQSENHEFFRWKIRGIKSSQP